MILPFEGVPTPLEVVRQTSGLVRRVGDYALSAVHDTRELVAPTKTPEEFVETLRQERPISEVHVAERALEAGERIRKEAVALVTTGQILSDTETKEAGLQKLEEAKVLMNIGYGMLKLTVVKAHNAYRKKEIPKEVVEEVFFAAVEDGADPAIKGFVPPDQAVEVVQVFEEYDNTIAFPNKK